MKELIEEIAKTLVEHPEEVKVRVVEGSHSVIFELRTHPADLGRMIGREGRTINAIRTLLSAAAVKHHKKVVLEVIENDTAANA